MAKLNIYHLFATASGRCFWIRSFFVDRATSLAYQTLVLEMKETEVKKILDLFACHRIDFTASVPPDERNSIMMNDFHHLLRTLARFTKFLSKW